MTQSGKPLALSYAELYLLGREKEIHLTIFLGSKFGTFGKGFSAEAKTAFGDFSCQSKSLPRLLDNLVAKIKAGETASHPRTPFHIGDFEVHVP